MAEEAEYSEGPARIATFADAVFAIAATLLVLDLKVPPGTRPSQLTKVLGDMEGEFFAYALSFAVIAAFWLAHHRMFSHVQRVDSTFLILNLVLLGFVALIPFPTDLMGTYANERTAVILYAGTVGVASIASTGVFVYASAGHRLFDPATSDTYIRHAWLRGASMAAVFLGSIPIALISVDAAKLFWIAIFVGRVVLKRRYGSINRSA